MTIIYAIILSILSNFTIILFFYLFSLFFEEDSTKFLVYLFIVPLGLIITVLPITPAGMGVGQAALYFLYIIYTGTDSQVAPNAFTVFQVILFAWSLLGGYFYVTRKKRTLARSDS